jgi:4-amino-4-deoxy-L-arabinose transferase-like glycosyltransferase
MKSIAPRRSPWLAPELYLIVALGAAIYGSRISALTIRGEEPRRARVAQEMMESGDWFVPTQQRLLFADRPPLGAWLMSASSALCGGPMTSVAVRLPTIVATLLTAVVIWLYARRFLSRGGAFAAACIFLTFGQVLQLGRLAECEGVFVALMATALLGWHALYLDGRSPWIVWTWGYSWAALAGLSKGPQGPIYFAAAAPAFLLVRRDWRMLLARGHLAGMAAFAAIFGAWLVPYWLKTDLESVRRLLFGTVTQRLGDDGSLLHHIVTYPWQIVGCLLPWSPLLARYAFRSFRAELGDLRAPTVFCAVAFAATFPSVWFAFGATSRHYMSLYPCMAVLAAVVVDRSWEAGRITSLGRGWSLFLYSIAGLAIAAGAVVVAAPWISADWAGRIRQPPLFTTVFLLSALATVVVIGFSLRFQSGFQRCTGVVAATCFLGLAYTGGIVNLLSAQSEDTPGSMAQLKGALPSDVKMVSLGEMDPLFCYHFRDPIPVVQWPQSADDLGPGWEYFAYVEPMSGSPELPFAWETVALVSCERNRQPAPQRVVRIGRRTDGKNGGHSPTNLPADGTVASRPGQVAASRPGRAQIDR